MEAKPGDASQDLSRAIRSSALTRLDPMTQPSSRPHNGKQAQSLSRGFAAAARAWGPWQLFWLALAVRLAVITLCHYYRINPEDDHFHFGAEMGRIARALATGRGYADPFLGPTGPTAWVPPLFPLILAGIFKLFGVYSTLSAWAVLYLRQPAERADDSLDLGDGRALLWPARGSLVGLDLGALSGRHAVCREVDLGDHADGLPLPTGAGDCAARRLRGYACRRSPGLLASTEADGPTWPRWLAFGLVWGLIALSNPGLLLFLPVCGLWMLARERKVAGQLTCPRPSLRSRLFCRDCPMELEKRSRSFTSSCFSARTSERNSTWATVRGRAAS